MLKKIIALTLVLLMIFSTNAFASSFFIDSRTFIVARKGIQTKIPALMYHKVSDNPAEFNDFVVTTKMLADDFAEIKARGYNPIFASEYFEVKKYSENLLDNHNYNVVAEFYKKYPKPIIITFDDGYKGIYNDVLPLMKEYNFKVNFYICGELIDKMNPEYCTWEEIKALNESGLAEIGNHTYSLHAKTKEELAPMYQNDFKTIIADINKNRAVIKEKTGVDCTVFSFPYGQYDYNAIANLKNAGYRAFISTDFRVNRVDDKQVTLGRFNRDSQVTTKDFFDLVDRKCNEI